MKKKAIYISIFVSLVIAIAYIYLNIYGFQPYKYTIEKLEPVAERAASNDRYRNEILSSETFEESSYSGGSIGELSYEQFIVNPSLIAIDGNPIPYLKDVREDAAKKAKDATLETSEYNKLTGDRDVRRYKIGKILEYTKSFYNQESKPSVTNPFGPVGSIVARSRTLARYDGSSYTLTAGEAWIAAHDRTLSSSVPEDDYSKARIDKVQSAMWKFKGKNGSEDDFGTNRVAGKVAESLAQEAKWMDEAVKKRKQLPEIIQDNMIGKYASKQAGIVTYNENTKEFLVGPFSINYVRDVHEPLKGGLSEMISGKQGGGNLIIYSGIVGAKVHAVVNGSEQELTDWEFVYPNVTESNGTVVRTAVANAGETGDAINNIYPYPNEEFYIKFFNPDNSIQALTKLEFDVQTLNSEGTARRLTGTFNNINWMVKQRWTDTLTRPEFERDEGWWVEDGYWEKDKDGNDKWIDTSYWHEHMVTYPNLYTFKYDAWVEDERAGAPQNAATLYQISRAKIYNEVRRVTVKVGEKYTDYKVYPTDYCIPLTMEIGGTVWYDGDEIKESQKQVDGINNNDERPSDTDKDKVKVRLYNNTTGQLVPDPLTGKEYFEIGFDGTYEFKYVQVGPKYYIEFEYDWMKYKNTKPLSLGINQDGSKDDYMNDPNKYLKSSHAQETESRRHDFNMDFYEITTNKGLGEDGSTKREMEYTETPKSNPYYQISTVQEFPEKTTTKEVLEIVLPLQSKYAIIDCTSSATEYMTVGQGQDGVCAITTVDKNQKLNYKFTAGSFMKVQTYLRHINLGLVEREPADFAVKSDVVSTTFTINEAYSNTNIITDPDPNNIGYRSRKDYETGNVEDRKEPYFNNKLTQEISRENYNWRYTFMEALDGVSNAQKEDELQVYVLYEYTIKNQSTLLSGYITELSNYFDSNYFYPIDNDTDPLNFYEGEATYKDLALRFMKYPSYYVKDNDIIPVNWSRSSKISGESDGSNGNITKMYTTSFDKVLLKPGEEIKVYVYYKVQREESQVQNRDWDLNIFKNGVTEYRDGKYVKLDNENAGKRTVTEINAYRSLDTVEYNGGKGKYDETSAGGSRVDIDSNPGNIDSRLNRTYLNEIPVSDFSRFEDDTDVSPLLRLTSEDTNGKEISGYVWEDLATVPGDATNQKVGNGIIDVGDEEKLKVNNVLAQLIRLEYDKNSGGYVERKFSENYEKYMAATNNYMLNNNTNFGAQYDGGKIALVEIKRRTGPQTGEDGSTNLVPIQEGQYRFTNLIESGQYKIRFTYGDEEHLASGNKGLTYNGHDYKSTEFNGWYDQKLLETDLNQKDMEKKVEISADIRILAENSKNNLDPIDYASKLADKLRETKQSPEFTVDVKSSLDQISNEIDSLSNSTKKSKILVLFIDNNIDRIQEQLFRALSSNILVIVATTSDVDSSAFNATYEGKSIIYYDQLLNQMNSDDTTYKNQLSEIYNRIINSALYTNIFYERYNQATDKLLDKTTINGPVYGRIDVMKKSQVIDYDMAKKLSIDEIKGMEEGEAKTNAIKTLAGLTQMTAESYPVSIHFDDNETTKNINLGLQKIPESSLELSKEVNDIKVTLSNGEEIVNWNGPDDSKRKNVQYFPRRSYNIYMDKEIMQGATIDIKYKINVINSGEVDTLWTYLKYESPEERAQYYKLLLEGLRGPEYTTQANKDILADFGNTDVDAKLKEPIRVQVNTLYDYYDNTIFRAEDNNRQDIETNNLKTSTYAGSKTEIARDEDNKPILGPKPNEYGLRNLVWTAVDMNDKDKYKVRDEVRNNIKEYKCVETSSLKDIELKTYNYTNNDDAVSTYITLSKTLDSKDFMNNDALVYRNYAEIIETYSINGRRFKDSQQGTLIPNPDYVGYDEKNQTDSDNAELVKILPPFGTQLLIGGIIAIVSLTAVGVTIYIIRRKRRNF